MPEAQNEKVGLVLARKPGEIIDIGDDIQIRVVDVHGDRVRIGINAPPNVTINRREVTIAMQQRKES